MPTKQKFFAALLFVAVLSAVGWGAIFVSDTGEGSLDSELLEQCRQEFETKGRQGISRECWQGMKGKYRVYFPPPERY